MKPPETGFSTNHSVRSTGTGRALFRVSEKSRSDVDPRRLFEVRESGSRVDLADDRASRAFQKVDTAEIETDGGGGLDRQTDPTVVRSLGKRPPPPSAVRSPLTVGGLEPGRRDDVPPGHEYSGRTSAALDPLLHEEFLAETPQRVHHRFEVITAATHHHTDPHPGTAHLDDDGQAQFRYRAGGEAASSGSMHATVLGTGRPARSRQQTVLQ